MQLWPDQSDKLAFSSSLNKLISFGFSQRKQSTSSIHHQLTCEAAKKYTDGWIRGCSDMLGQARSAWKGCCQSLPLCLTQSLPRSVCGHSQRQEMGSVAGFRHLPSSLRISCSMTEDLDINSQRKKKITRREGRYSRWRRCPSLFLWTCVSKVDAVLWSSRAAQSGVSWIRSFRSIQPFLFSHAWQST